MSKLNQIQNELQQISGEAFQKLADAYLHKRGYEQINPLGSVIGADQVRPGTPDTLVPLPTGKYVFAEYTTTESDKIIQKFKKDLKKCFDEAKTQISVNKIQEIVFCHTSMLEPDKERDLKEECQKRGVNLNIFGIGPISFDLYQKYPGIARDFLGVEVDTGQIVDIAEFVDAYNKRASTPLNTAFYFREEELERVLQRLESDNLVIVFGKAGVGKSRFVLECCKRFLAAHSEYQVRSIFFRGQDLFEDLRVYFSAPGSYLIFVDDANRVNSFKYFTELLHEQRGDQKIKVIATARDYALNKVLESAKSYKNCAELELNSLDEKQVKQLLKDEYEILNPFYLDRIVEIAQGNPRLAIMAALIAKENNTLDSIHDVSNLYDEYYSSIRKDIDTLNDKTILKTAAIVAFFRTVDRSNEAMMNTIERAFELDRFHFWEAVGQLHDYELLDVYENEVARFSDQVLATYIFYLAFFKKRLLNFGILLDHFFPNFQYRLVDALNPVLNTFDDQKCIEVMRPIVDRVWERYKNAEDKTNLMQFIEVFWFLKKTDILVYIYDCISTMEPEPIDPSKLEIKSNSSMPSSSILSTLALFRYSDENNLRMALNLALEYTTKRPTEISQVISLLSERFGFDHEFYLYGFATQRLVIDILWEKAENSNDVDVMFAKLFLAVAENYLNTEFDASRMKGRNTINIFKFTLVSTPELVELRRTLWERVFRLYEIGIFKEDILKLLHNYSTSGHKVSVGELIGQDSLKVLSFIQSKLDASSYFNCFIVQSYLDHLERHNIPFSEDLREGFKNKTYSLSEVLFSNRLEKQDLNLGYQEYEQLRQQRIQDFFANYNLEDYKQFFEQCLEIQQETDLRKHNTFYLPGQVVRVLIALADRDPQLYTDVVKHYLDCGDPLKINDLRIINKLIQFLGIDNSYEIISRLDDASKRKWLFDFYYLLPEELIREEHLTQLYSLYRESAVKELPNDFTFLTKYHKFDEDVLINIVEIILDNTVDSLRMDYPILSHFFISCKTITDLLELFKNQSLRRA